MPGLDVTVQAIGAGPVVDHLEGVEHRMVNAQPAFLEVEGVLERGEQRLFDRLHGKYVQTGATRESLTQRTADQAIREAHAAELVFGTKVWYAKFLRKPGTKKSAVLVLQPKERKAATQVLLDHILGRHDEALG